ncbi:helix-turn-helix domain-containing protein [Curtobacterium sp. RRHDQ10]|uniref:helix-turn-helix domain-containing protein n=1 Tax=Curtobacterium phyllosphaerae TaxID=3413379 RepID=UPI003BF07324
MNQSRVQELRVGRGWTQERLASESGVAVRTIQRLESGKDAALETVALIAAALEVPATELFGTVERPVFETALDGLEERTAAQQTRRDATVRAWRSLYMAVGVAVSILVIVLVSTRTVPGVAFLVVGLYWAAGGTLMRFLITTVLDPRLDVRYPLSQPSSGARGRSSARLR